MLRNLRLGMLWGIVAAFVVIAAACAGAWWYSLAVPGESFRGPLPQATSEEAELASRLKQHVVAIASAPHNIRHYANLEAAARHIEAALAAAGYRVNAQVFEAHDYAVRNLEVTIEPQETGPQVKTIVIGAHYDSVDDVPGANDNGSGTAAVIELARLLKDFKPRRTRLRLVLFVNEEPPYFKTEGMGSLRYADALAARNEPVAAMIALDTVGFFSDAPGSQHYPAPFGALLPDRADFIAFVGMMGSRPLVHKVIASFRKNTAFPSIGGVAPGFIPGMDWSDHWAFAEHGFQALMVTDTALFRYADYHKPSDTPDKVDYERLARITSGLARVIRELAD